MLITIICKENNVKKLTDEQVKALQDKFLGKRITYMGMTGKCEYLQYNPFLPSWGLQLTIERTPIQHVDPKKIRIFVPRYPESPQ